MFVFVKSIFCPNRDFLSYNIKSLLSILDYWKKINKKCLFIFIGWIPEIHLMKSIYEILERFINKKIIFLSKNFGKYYVFNYIQKYISDDHFLLYFDHDIVIDNNDDSFYNILHLPHLMTKYNINLIAFDQREDKRHRADVYKNCIYIEDHLFYTNLNPYSLAMGAFIAKTNIFNKITFHLYSVYGMDDYELINEIKIKDNNKYSVLLSDICIIHPYYNNIEYLELKKNMVKFMLENNYENNYIDIYRESFNLFDNSQFS